MARKKELAYETEQYTFPARLRGLMKETGTKQKELAQALGVKPQTVSLYCQGQSFPDVNNLAKIAQFFSVSADYLIGLSETPSLDMDVQKINEITGLSAESVAVLKRERNLNLLYWRMDTINFLLENDLFYLLLDMMIGVVTSKGEKIPYAVSSNNLSPTITDTDVFRAKVTDLTGSILTSLKENFEGRDDLRTVYGVLRAGYKEGEDIETIKEMMEQEGLVFDRGMFEED